MNTDVIKQLLKERGLTLYKLSREAEISYSTLHDIIITRKTKNPNIDTVKKIADFLGEKIEKLI